MLSLGFCYEGKDGKNFPLHLQGSNIILEASTAPGFHCALALCNIYINQTLKNLSEADQIHVISRTDDELTYSQIQTPLKEWIIQI